MLKEYFFRFCGFLFFIEILAYITVPAEAQLAAVITPNNRSSIFIARKDEKLVLQCTANVDGEPRRVKSVKWFDESGTELNYEFGRIFVIEYPPQEKKRLVFSSLGKDTGKYRCMVEDGDGHFAEDFIDLYVEEPIQFLTPQKLSVQEHHRSNTTLKCTAVGHPTPEVSVRLSSGATLPEDYFLKTEDGGYVIINPVRSSPYNKVQCIATQVDPTKNYFNMEQMIVTIDVHYPPKFEVPYGENDYSDDVIPVGKAYGIKGRDSRIPCHVIDSNPAVHQFKFYNAQTQEIHADNIRYSLEHDVPNHTATLIIHNVDDPDIEQEYECSASSISYVRSIKFKLLEVLPPGQLQTVFQSSSDSSVTLKFTDPPETGTKSDAAVSITQYRVAYWPKPSRDDERVPDSEKTIIEFPKKDRSKYSRNTITGLRPEVEYVIQTEAGNPAGWGEPSPEIVVRTQKFGVNGANHFNRMLFSTTITLLVSFLLQQIR